MSASVQPPVVCTATCHPVIGPCHVWTATCHVCTVPCVISVLVQLSPKMPKLSDTCHLLVLPRVPLTSPVVLPMSVVRHVDFDQFDILPIWEIYQNTITFAYGVHLWKKIYGRNQRDEPDAMALGSSDSENFDF
jgi:hypothetical protein